MVTAGCELYREATAQVHGERSRGPKDGVHTEHEKFNADWLGYYGILRVFRNKKRVADIKIARDGKIIVRDN